MTSYPTTASRCLRRLKQHMESRDVSLQSGDTHAGCSGLSVESIPSKVLIALQISILQELLNRLPLIHFVGCKSVSSPKERKHSAGSELRVIRRPDHGRRVSRKLVGVVDIGCSCRLELCEIQSGCLKSPSRCTRSSREARPAVLMRINKALDAILRHKFNQLNQRVDKLFIIQAATSER